MKKLLLATALLGLMTSEGEATRLGGGDLKKVKATDTHGIPLKYSQHENVKFTIKSGSEKPTFDSSKMKEALVVTVDKGTTSRIVDVAFTTTNGYKMLTKGVTDKAADGVNYTLTVNGTSYNDSVGNDVEISADKASADINLVIEIAPNQTISVGDYMDTLTLTAATRS